MRQARLLFILGLTASTYVVPAVPAVAQVEDRVVIIYGDDKCPASNGQEIVVCRRLPNSERYRIPKDLRESEVAPQALGGQAVSAMQTTGGTGVQIQSCNSVGAGVNAGCLKKEADAWTAAKKAEKDADAGVP